MVAETPPEEVRARLEAGEGFDLVDIRDADAYDEAHIPGAENVPLDDLEDAVDDREWADEVIVACYVGESSVQVARFLDARTDAEVSSMAGGYDAWRGDLE
ncbi:rhodanese-like domain-containing protein [Halegenticoccus soli]|uniref:rhodanese-like domain-containing protein n=1 Tax=Halegenticoccus soli TaxID=1985678 RepID=UPI000C6D3738|nr:rhodanese-like domain-containing protein [Halegenticoccus soli]